MKQHPIQKTKKLKDFIRNPIAWPGCYDRFAITHESAVLCYNCVKSNLKTVMHSTKYNYKDSWDITDFDNLSNYDNYDQSEIKDDSNILICDHCSKYLNVVED